LPQVTEPVPVSVSVVEPSVQTILQLDPLPLDVQSSPSVDSVPHRQIVTPFNAAVQHSPPELLVPEQPAGSPSTRARPKANPTAPARFILRAYGGLYRTSIGPSAKYAMATRSSVTSATST
jgi:hypothetical protein